MNINSLSNELFYKIFDYLDTKSIVRLTTVNKKFNNFDNDYHWKKLCEKDYQYSVLINNNISIKLQYILCYDTLCTECYTKTKNYNFFFKRKVCHACQKNIPLYFTVSYTNAKTKYYLDDNDLKNLNCSINKSYSRTTKHYLESDILNTVDYKYGYYHYEELKKKKIGDRVFKQLQYVIRSNLLHEILLNEYNVNIYTILSGINIYTEGLYLKFIKNVGMRQTVNVDSLIYKCIELDFIYNITNDSIPFIEWRDSFDVSLMKYLIITNSINNSNHIHPYIQDKIYNLFKYNKDIFLRKKEILDYAKHHISNTEILNEKIVIDHILYGKCVSNSTPKRFVQEVILYKFLIKYTDYRTLYIEYSIKGEYFNTEIMYLFILNKWYLHNKHLRYLVPKILLEFILY